MDDKCIYLCNSYHLGDNVFNLILFYNIKNYIENNDIIIYYYLKNEYISQISEFVCSKNIILSSLENKPHSTIELWIGNGLFNYNNSNMGPDSFNDFYKKFFNIVLKFIGIDYTLSKFFYDDNNFVDIYNSLDNKFKNIDILILNSQPLSGQYNYDKNMWDKYIIDINNYFKISTTTKVITDNGNNILCTADDNLTIKSIAALSRNVKVIIAVNSGVVPALLNYTTLTSVKKFYIFDDRCYYSYPNFENKKYIHDISIEELSQFTNQ